MTLVRNEVNTLKQQGKKSFFVADLIEREAKLIESFDAKLPTKKLKGSLSLFFDKVYPTATDLEQKRSLLKSSLLILLLESSSDPQFAFQDSHQQLFQELKRMIFDDKHPADFRFLRLLALTLHPGGVFEKVPNGKKVRTEIACMLLR